jgi:hypothetical protein
MDDVGDRIIKAAKRRTTNREALNRLEDMEWAPAYAEPGYTQPKRGGIYFANWNDIDIYEDGKRRLDGTMSWLAERLERYGAAIEWSDEWRRCALCGKAVRTSPDSYSWQPSYFMDDDEGEICLECVTEDPAPYMEALEGQTGRAWTLDIDPAEHGYRLLEGEFEAGLHPGQDDKPEEIAARLQAQGIERFLFRVEALLLGGPGLDGYAYQATVYCEECAEEIIRRVFAERGGRMDGLDFQDSEKLPQPIFFGESGCAEHCDDCGEYLYGPRGGVL